MKQSSKPRAFLGRLLTWLRRRRTPPPPKRTSSDEEAVLREEGSVRMKLVLTKKEAAQLMALYVEGFRRRGDGYHPRAVVEKKLVGFKLEKNAAKIRSSSVAWTPMLESIPEH